jgi:hypothetical protein
MGGDSRAMSPHDFHLDNISKTGSLYYPPGRLLTHQLTRGVFRYGKADMNVNIGRGTSFKRCLKTRLRRIFIV